MTITSLVDPSHDVRDFGTMFIETMTQAVLHNIGSILMLRIDQNLVDSHIDELQAVFKPSMVHDVLYDIVAVLVLDQNQSTGMELFDNLSSGRLRTVFKHSLDDTTPVRVRGEVLYLALHSSVDEGDMLSGNPLDCFLDDMISVLIFDAFEDVVLQLLDQYCLLIGKNVLKSLLSLAHFTRVYKTTLPFAQHGIHTSAGRVQQHGPSFCLPFASSASDSHAQRTSESRSCQRHRSLVAMRWGRSR